MRIALAVLSYNAPCQSNVTNTKINTQFSISCTGSFTVAGERLSGLEISASISALCIFSLRLSLPLPTLLYFTGFIFKKAEFWDFTWIAIDFSTIFTPVGLYFFFTIIHIVKQLFACCLKSFFQGYNSDWISLILTLPVCFLTFNVAHFADHSIFHPEKTF